MKKLKILRAFSGVKFSFMGNEVTDMEDAEAKPLLDAGFAEEIPVVTIESTVETATPPQQPEKATAPVASKPWSKRK